MASAKRTHEPDNSSNQMIEPANKRQKLELASLGLDLNSLQKIDPEGDVVLSAPVRCRRSMRIQAMTGTTAQVLVSSFLVSSTHLKTASEYFKGLLSERWPKGRALASGRVVQIGIDDCKAEELLLILNIIHGNFRAVPQKISFQTLVDVSLAADFFQCTDVVQPFALRWIDDLKADLPSKWTPEIPEWIMISVLFRHEDTFAHVTKIAVEHGTCPFETHNLPIPGNIKGMSQSNLSQEVSPTALTLNLDQIDSSREEYLQKALGGIKERIRTLVLSRDQSSLHCSSICSMESLGRLIQVLAMHNIPFCWSSPDTLDIQATSGLLEGLSPCEIRAMVKNNSPATLHRCTDGIFCEFRNFPWGSDIVKFAVKNCGKVKMKKTQ
ncbi:unnamed protein product [Penicillium salamii]|uniref:BTB domain-containing protein n=1 Tax=Penicillium salamii TaxID=1612424 RepID=A0A9W4NC39_9EURO|nr:unnamed protein product [Penicillium salamii]CAG8053240.1 unnamed protein product [Penicillium salamii]CAG8329284.1 unnamed protein product [Penicillium salamii]CAG8329482.1 unnamed protein product [Penicillium salamii]CAG8338261.1 unnamed protein product [Penicillium salamii]